MITIPQIKAARALLGWTQDELARASGLSLPSINNMERALYAPRPESMAAVRTALEEGGIEFMPQNGLRLRQKEHDLVTLTGPTFMQELERDMLAVLRAPEDELLGLAVENWAGRDFAFVCGDAYAEARLRGRWGERFLLPETRPFETSMPDSYRFLPDLLFGRISFFLYGNRLAIVESDVMRVTLLKNKDIQDSFRRQFDALWCIGRTYADKQSLAQAA